MVLHAIDGLGLVAQPFHRLIVKVNAIDFDFRGQGIRIHGKPVILGCDLDPPGFQIFHRLIAAAMAKRQLESLAAKRAPK